MAVVMILQGRPAADGSVVPTPYDGQYLRDFDFEAGDGRGEVTMTTNIKKAKRFKNGMEAFQFYRRQPECKPIREDGEPNRPLTATNWEFRAVGWLQWPERRRRK